MVDITVLIPTRNEIKHIERAVTNALKLTPYVYIIDSASTDGTIQLAESLGARVYQYEWTEASSFSAKINWALSQVPISTTWAIRLDADEFFMENCITYLADALAKLSDDVNGATLIRRIYFMGRWMKYSNEYPKTSMRIFRVGYAEMEDRWLDEHVNIKEGKFVHLPYDIVDDSRLNLTEWMNKHNGYAIKEAMELIHQEIELFDRQDTVQQIDDNAKKKKKEKRLYSRLPKYWRPFFFFCYRYFLKLGFLDGKEGFLWNFFQCWWYRTLADAKVDEIYKACGKDRSKIISYLMDTYHLDCR